jgi:hypothetical protein
MCVVRGIISGPTIMNEFSGYDAAHEQVMRRYSRSLPEDHRRRYAAVEAQKIGYGGVAYVARVLGMSRASVHRGLRELEGFDDDNPQRPSGDPQRVRRPGAGRPPRLETDSEAEETFNEVMEAHSAGSPTDERVRWSDLNPGRLAQELLERGIAISRNTAAAWLKEAGFRPRALRKELITGVVDPQERDAQFRYIAELRAQAAQAGLPVFSGDTKKKELLGALHRCGTCYSREDQYVYEHDFRHLADGMLVPHGVYDPMRNLAFMTLGTSRETSAFVCDAIALAWETLFQPLYPDATEILLLFDCGGANAARSLRFKEDLIALSARLGLPLRIAHYPPYTSKWNPIEHRLFSQIEKRWRGIILDTPEKALATLEQTRTKTGLRVVGQILDRCYEIGRACSDNFRSIKDNFIRPDPVMGSWNYVVNAKGFDAQVV